MSPQEQGARAALMRRNGRIAGFLFVFGALLTVPSSLLLEPLPSPWAYLLIAVGVGSGLVCLRIPWQRLPPAALNAVAAIATVEVALACAVFDPTYRVLYFIVGVYAAMVLRTRLEVGMQLGLITLALLAPALYDPGAAREHLRAALLLIPTLTIAATAVRYLRETLATREQIHAEFAREAIELAARIGGPREGPSGGRFDPSSQPERPASERPAREPLAR